VTRTLFPSVIFLQQQTDVVASRHHNPRGANAGAVDLVDITIALPDFVQDHLVLEAESSQGHNSDAPLDLSVLHQVLPEFTSSQRNSIGRRMEDESRNADGGAYAHSSNSTSQSQSTTLPDFLSDGPMYCTSNNETTNSNSNHSSFAISPCIKSGSPENRSEMNQRSQSVDTDSQTQQVERLRRELMEKTRSITQLQHEVARQRSEIHGLREALTAAERRVPASHNDMASGDQAEHGSGSILNSRSNEASRVVPVNGSATNDRDHAHSSRVLQVVETSESLIRKLMHQINALKNVAADIENQEQDKDK